MKTWPTRAVRTLFCAGFLLIQPMGVCAEREEWSTSHIHGSPEPPLPYRVERIFSKITFDAPLDAVSLPGTDRTVIVEQHGELFSIPADETAEKAQPFADLKRFEPETVECYGIAFHPRFAENRYAFVWINLDLHGERTREKGTEIVRFRVTGESPPQLDLKSGQIIFSWLGGGHNGGDVRFGPDGMLYISTGDAGSPDPPDPLATGQDIGDVLASILRIDVDHPDAGTPYGVPKDNPFVSTPGARGEVWAYGFRNPWRLSFDSKSGALWVGDVGWELWEMIHRVERGGNYGWSITEAGRQDVRPDRPRGPTPILPPIVVHSHEEAASITGGEVYYGKRLPSLQGAYVYGDWQMGTFWAWKDGKVQELCRSTLMPAGFGIAPDGELIICDHAGGGLWRLAPNPDAGRASQFPRKLSETGFFTDVARQIPATGVVPYEVTAPRWADHATAARWVGVPSTEAVVVARKELGVQEAGRWVFPKETVFAKTYALEMERGDGASRRKIETQILHFDGLNWGAYSYRWNEAQTDAELVPARGADETFEVKDKTAPGGIQTQPWRYFSRAECLRCHNLWLNFTPGYSPLQLDRPTSGTMASQLETLSRLGLAVNEVKFANPYENRGSLEVRARSYLHANCSTCHRANAGGAVPSFMNMETPLGEARLVEAKPILGTLGLPEGRIVAPGDASRSVLLYRMATAGRGHMPYLGGQLVDNRGLVLIRDWIDSLPRERDLPTDVQRQREADHQALARLKMGDAASLDELLATASGSLGVALAVTDGTLSGEARGRAIRRGSELTDPLRRGLFDQFLPDSERRKAIGASVDRASLLGLHGDAAHGKVLFAALCAACHRVGKEGTDFGPELTHIGAKYERSSLLEQILQPSLVVDQQWQLTVLTLKSGETASGFLEPQQDAQGDLTLRLPGGVRKTFARGDVVKKGTERVSAMPEGLLQNLTLGEAADLLEYAASLK